jgi:hypothetical protein
MVGSVAGRAQTINQLVEYARPVTAVILRVPNEICAKKYPA